MEKGEKQVSITINYQDQNGNPTTLYKLVRTEPDWAASRINFMNNKIAELEKELEFFYEEAMDSKEQNK